MIGEFTIASLLGYENLQVVIVRLGLSDGPTSVVASLATLLLGFGLLGVLSLFTRGRKRSAAAEPTTPMPPVTATGPAVSGAEQ